MFSYATLTLIAAMAGIIGEGFSAESPSKTIDAGWRMFTNYTGPEVCLSASIPDRLVGPPIRVRTHERFQLSDLRVSAYTADDVFLPRIPVQIEFEETKGILARDMQLRP